MKIYRIAGNFDNLQNGTIILSKLYKTEGNIKILERKEKKDILGNPMIKYEAFFSNSGRYGTIDAKDISSIVSA
jgi:hypothetical protein